MRLWVAPETPRYDQDSPTKARLRWAVSIPGLIGLLAVLPAFMFAGGYAITGADAASVFCILWILKVGLHAPAFSTLARVVSNERAPIASVLILFAILLMMAATGAHMLERVAPARAVRHAARRHVVGGGHAHHDGLRRRRAAHGRRPHGRLRC